MYKVELISNLILKYWDAVFIVLLSFGLYFIYQAPPPDAHVLVREENYLRLILLWLLIGLIANSKDIFQENKNNKWIIVLVLGEVLFVLWHLNFFAFKKLFLDASLFFIFFYSLPRTRSSKWLGIFSWVFFAIAILHIFPIGDSIWDVSDNSYKASFIHRNALGYILVTAFIFISFLKVKIQIKYFLAALYLIVVFLTFSRTTLIASTLIWCWFLFPQGKMKAILLTIALHGAIVFAWHNDLTQYFDFSGEVKHELREFDGSTLERWNLLKSGLIAYAENPIMGKSELYVTDVGHTKGSHIHNFYLSHLISYGIFPSIAVGLMFYLFFQKTGIRVRLMILNLAIFASFQGYFDTFQSAYFFITILVFYLFNYLDLKEKSSRLNLIAPDKA